MPEPIHPILSTPTIIDLFDKQVAATPDAVALTESDRRVSFAELSAQVDRVASGLRACGVDNGALVALLLPRSIEAVVAMLGILKAGAGYLPIDPKYPAPRINYMLGNAGAALVLRENRHSLPTDIESACRVVGVDEIAASAPTLTSAPVDPESVAYVIYTSGSTGTPKGVQIPHRALLHYVQWARNYYVNGEPVDMPLFSSLAFDLTVTSIYLPLVTGGRVVIYREEAGPRDLAIYGVIKDNQVDMIKLTPSHLSLVGRMDLGTSRVRRLILGGEDLKAALAGEIHRAFGGRVQIYNEYGPTEATVGCMEYCFDPEQDSSGSVPIGRPIDGAEILLLDDDGHPVASPATGEIYIGGPGLALGYINNPAATAERFLPHPARAGVRVYKTGDLARQRADGCLEYLGRSDRQFKLGGIRIEPEEVETVLQEYPNVQSAAVAVHAPRSENKIFHCVRCALPSNYPGVSYDEAGLCNVCREYDSYKDRAQAYFRSMDELRRIFAEAKAHREGDYDCLMLLSGGKDSSYVLYQLLDMDLEVLTFTLDNGYISDGAKDNIRRLVNALGVDHIFGTADAMDAIFHDSLRQFSNVCNGCFKTLYTLSMQLAHDKQIKYIVTGLSRGQLFETRLDFLFRNQVFDLATIERDVQRARRVYHAQHDVVSRNLQSGPSVDPEVLREIEFIDFYRYSDVKRDGIMGYLESRKDWTRPADTGRSTNCLINDVGIYVHNRERGFHNYALPYCWEVRLGLLDREEALHELGTDVNMENVTNIMSRLDYKSTREFRGSEPRLIAYYVANGETSPEALRSHASAKLPPAMVPADFVPLDELPLTANGKVDWDALPAPDTAAPKAQAAHVVGTDDELERNIIQIWERLLGTADIGVGDNFFDRGGTSLLAVILYTQLEDLLDDELPDPVAEKGWTVAEQAAMLREHGYRH